MRYATVALALVGAAYAAESVAWEPIETPASKKVDPTTVNSWEPVEKTPEPKKVDPTTVNSWEPVEESKKPEPTHKVPEKETSKSADPTTWDPVKFTKTTTPVVWETYPEITKTTTPVKETGKCSYVTEVETTACAPKKTEICWTTKVETTIYPEKCTWQPVDLTTKTPVDPKSTWAPAPVDPKKTWASASVDPKSTWAPAPVDPKKTWASASVDPKSTWAPAPVDPKSTWSAVWDSTKTMKSTVTETKTAEWSVITSVAAWSKDGWFGPAWPTAKAGECVQNVVTSYGAAEWKPTPEAATTWATVSVPAAESETKTWSSWAGEATGGHAVIAPNGNKWSMTYNVYDAQSKCKTEEVIKADVKAIKELGFTSVRVYSTDCKTLEYVGNACRENGLKIILGVFISKTGISGAAGQVSDILAWKQWDLVEMIVVGNEATFQGFCKAEELGGFIKECKGKFAAAGYTGAVTTTEPLEQWQNAGKQWCDSVDVVAANLYAFFNEQTKAEDAGAFIASEMEILEGICSGKDTYVMETGWPSEGQPCGAAVPSKENQATAIKSIQEHVGSKVCFFSFEDEQWKEPGQYGVEQHWGCAEVFGYKKPAQSSWEGY